MKRLQLFIASTLILIGLDCAGQSQFAADLPQLLPASPEATAFVKVGVGNANLSTGAATASIPLYTIKLGDFTFPISMSYSTQGLKVDEASTRVGYGWSLQANGMITRSVRDKPDEMVTRKVAPTDYVTDTDELFSYLMNYSEEDTQADEFQFHCNGYSGKFVVTSSFQPVLTATANLQIVIPSSLQGPIYITTPDGVRYKFETYERTTNHNIGRYASYKIVKTAFFLDRIDLPNGEYIDFHYSPIDTKVNTGYSETAQIFNSNGVSQCGSCPSNSYSSQLDGIDYHTQLLNSITVSNGQTINFTYQSRPDLSMDKRLSQFEVVGLKKYQFEYYDSPGSSNQVNGRFFLTKIKDVTAPAVLSHSFTYDDMVNVPLPITYRQDYAGFYNGSSATSFIPINANSSTDFSFRNPVWTESKKGTLTKIEFPTGGTEEFIYEGNTESDRIKRNTSTSTTVSGPGGGIPDSPDFNYYTSSSINILRDQTVTLSTYAEDQNPNDAYTASPSNTVSVWLYQGTTMIASRSASGYAISSSTFTLPAGVYTLKIGVRSCTEIGYGKLEYDAAANDVYDTLNVPIPGVRLRQIKYTDPFTAATHSKYYTYSKLSDLRHSLSDLRHSTGEGGANVQHIYHAGHQSNVVCALGGNGLAGRNETDCYLNIYSSTTTNLYNNSSSGSAIYYTVVIESDDPDFQNGGTEYTFFGNDSGLNSQVMRGDNFTIPSGEYPTLTGVIQKKRVFDRNKIIVQEELDEYENLTYMTNSVNSIYVRKKWEPLPAGDLYRLDPFDVVRSTYSNNWIRLKSKTITSYAYAIALVQKTNYSYGTTSNILPAAITTTDSKGVELKTEKRYPTDPDLVSVVNSKLVGKNILTPVIDESSYRSGTLIQQRRVLYKDWFNNNLILAPEIIQLKQSASDVLHDAIKFKQYDNNGNPLELQKVNDIPIAYLWDAQLDLPIAEVRNASADQVAYTSFENNAFGGWAITSGGTTSTGPYTGSLSFSGGLQKSVSGTVAQTYVITAWTSSTTVPTANLVAGTKIRSSNGLDLYQWKFTNITSTTFSIAGTQIDEVRLHPESAQLIGYTYKPFIGPATVTDANNRTTFYSYDASNRLDFIKDQDGNVVKTFEYHYQQQN